MMGYRSPLALASAIIVAPALNLVSSFQSMSNQCSPPTPALYQTYTSTTALCAWDRALNRSGGGGLEGGGGSRIRWRQQHPLRAYTVADNIGRPSWFPFLKFPLPFADVAAQFFGLEGTHRFLLHACNFECCVRFSSIIACLLLTILSPLVEWIFTSPV